MVDEGFVTPEQLALALAEQKRTERPIGAIFVDLGFVSAGAVANALAEQHGGLLKTEFGISAGLHAVPGGAAISPRPLAVAPAPAPAADSAGTRVKELEAQLHTVLTERNALVQSVNERQAMLAEAAQKQDAEVARVTNAAAAHIKSLEAEAQATLAGRDEVISQLQREVAALREEAEQRQHEPAADEARIRSLEAEAQAAIAGRDGLISQLQREVAALGERAEQRQHEPAAEKATEEAAVGRAHLLFVPSSSGYALIEFPGPDPPSGTVLDVDGVGYVVRRVGASPFPGSRLRCVFVEPV